MKTQRLLLASSVSLALVACQQQATNPVATSTLLKPQSKNSLSLTAASQASKPGKHFEVETMSATLVRVGDTHELRFKLKMPHSFRTQVVDAEELAKVKITVMAEDIDTPLTSNFVTVVDGEATATISNIPISSSRVRVVSAQGYNEDNLALPAFEAKASYKSNSSNITLNINRRQLVLGEILEELLTRESELTNSLDRDTLQDTLDDVIYGSQEVGGTTFDVDPLHFDIAALTDYIEGTGLPDETVLKENLASATGFDIDIFIATEDGNQFGQDITVLINDPGSSSYDINDKANSPMRTMFKGILPGSWDLLVKDDEGNILDSSTVVVDNEGMVTLGDGETSDAPFTISGVASRTVDCSSSTALPANVLAVAPCGDEVDPDGSTWAEAYTDLNEALDAATDDDEVWVAVGTYTPDVSDPGNTGISFEIPGNVSLYGGFTGGETARAQRNPQAKPVLSGDLDGDDIPETFGNYVDNASNVITEDASSGDDITLDGFIVEGGNETENNQAGGGFFSDNYINLTIANCEFRHNKSEEGGGLYWYTSNREPRTLNITDTVFHHNHAVNGGGGAYIYASNSDFDINLTNVLFENNTADDNGGGAYVYLYPDNSGGNSADISNSIFRGNSADNNGGGLYIMNSSNSPVDFNITSTIFENNTATNKGGGVYISFESSHLDVGFSNSLFRNNTADYGGGLFAIISDDYQTLDIESSVFNSNQATSDGGGLYLQMTRGDSVDFDIVNCIFANNTADGDGGAAAFVNTFDSKPLDAVNIAASTFYNNRANNGGAIFANKESSSRVVIDVFNSIFWGNSATGSGNQFYVNNEDGCCTSNELNIDYSIVEDLDGDDFAGDGDYNIGDGMLDSDPMFSNISLLWGVDGVPGTSDDGLIPMLGSPAIDAGVSSKLITDDIRGVGRPQGAAYDIGAFEVE